MYQSALELLFWERGDGSSGHVALVSFTPVSSFSVCFFRLSRPPTLPPSPSSPFSMCCPCSPHSLCEQTNLLHTQPIIQTGRDKPRERAYE